MKPHQAETSHFRFSIPRDGSFFGTSQWFSPNKVLPCWATVLKSERAVQVNIAIIRAFVQMRELLSTNRNLARKLDDLEKKQAGHDENFRIVFEANRQLMEVEEKPKRKTGF